MAIGGSEGKGMCNLGSRCAEFSLRGPICSASSQWSQSVIYNISWGDPYSEAVPEIYSDDDNDEQYYDGPQSVTRDISMTDEWKNVSKWGYANNTIYGAIQFYGVLDEYPAKPSIGPVSEAWTNFTNQLNGNSETAQVSPIPYLTNI